MQVLRSPAMQQQQQQPQQQTSTIKRVRTGCERCKKHRVKCDETKPGTSPLSPGAGAMLTAGRQHVSDAAATESRVTTTLRRRGCLIRQRPGRLDDDIKPDSANSLFGGPALLNTAHRQSRYLCRGFSLPRALSTITQASAVSHERSRYDLTTLRPMDRLCEELDQEVSVAERYSTAFLDGICLLTHFLPRSAIARVRIEWTRVWRARWRWRAARAEGCSRVEMREQGSFGAKCAAS